MDFLDLASSVVCAIDFFMGLEASSNSSKLVKLIENPSQLPSSQVHIDAYVLLEEMLKAGKQKNKVAIEHHRMNQGVESAIRLGKRLGINVMGIRILMSRIAGVFDYSSNRTIHQFGPMLVHLCAIGVIQQAVVALKTEDSTSVEQRSTAYWETLLERAHIYASTYPDAY